MRQYIHHTRQLYKSLRQLRQSKEGVTSVEFAFLAPVLFLTMMGIVEISLMLFAQNVIESATFNASRLGKTGYVESGQTQEQTMLDALHHYSSALLDTSKLTVTSIVYDQFDQVGQPEPFVDVNNNGIRDEGENYTDTNGNGQYDEDMGLAGMGAATQVVVYTVTYPWEVFTPIISHFVGDNGTMNLSARTVVQNEPY